jgi:hypothetical protein
VILEGGEYAPSQVGGRQALYMPGAGKSRQDHGRDAVRVHQISVVHRAPIKLVMPREQATDMQGKDSRLLRVRVGKLCYLPDQVILGQIGYVEMQDVHLIELGVRLGEFFGGESIGLLSHLNPNLGARTGVFGARTGVLIVGISGLGAVGQSYQSNAYSRVQCQLSVQGI